MGWRVGPTADTSSRGRARAGFSCAQADTCVTLHVAGPAPGPPTQWGGRETPSERRRREGGPFVLCGTAAYGAGVVDVLSCSHGSSVEWSLWASRRRGGQPVMSESHQGHQRGLGLITFGCPGQRQGHWSPLLMGLLGCGPHPFWGWPGPAWHCQGNEEFGDRVGQAYGGRPVVQSPGPCRRK